LEKVILLNERMASQGVYVQGQMLKAVVRVTQDELTIYDPAFVTAACHRLFPRSVVGQRSHCPDHEPPRDSQQRLEQLTARYAEFGAAGARFLEGLLACTRYGKNQAERVLSLAAAYPRLDVLAALERAVQYGAFSLQAIARILATRSQPKTPLDALAEDQRRHLPPWLDENPVSPRPTSDYQGLLSEEPHDAEKDRPRSPSRAAQRGTAGRKQWLRPACMTTSQRRCEHWGLRWLPMRSTQRCLRRRRNH
jgi:hypothetical protein